MEDVKKQPDGSDYHAPDAGFKPRSNLGGICGDLDDRNSGGGQGARGAGDRAAAVVVTAAVICMEVVVSGTAGIVSSHSTSIRT